jgi:hypothetical protein
MGGADGPFFGPLYSHPHSGMPGISVGYVPTALTHVWSEAKAIRVERWGSPVVRKVALFSRASISAHTREVSDPIPQFTHGAMSAGGPYLLRGQTYSGSSVVMALGRIMMRSWQIATPAFLFGK